MSKEPGALQAGFSPSTNNPLLAFLGVVSDTPIWRIVYQDTNISGGRVLQEISLGQINLTTVPLPATLPLLATVLTILGLARRRRPPPAALALLLTSLLGPRGMGWRRRKAA